MCFWIRVIILLISHELFAWQVFVYLFFQFLLFQKLIVLALTRMHFFVARNLKFVMDALKFQYEVSIFRILPRLLVKIYIYG